ncbi:hypothetical protein DFJ74DRAFT_759891 [Hyaloraphidium curvatum]|nr:hypothetical protein DFJ74DRAFT_759891 [Hyaloraphidium curvatum]
MTSALERLSGLLELIPGPRAPRPPRSPSPDDSEDGGEEELPAPAPMADPSRPSPRSRPPPGIVLVLPPTGQSPYFAKVAQDPDGLWVQCLAEGAGPGRTVRDWGELGTVVADVSALVRLQPAGHPYPPEDLRLPVLDALHGAVLAHRDGTPATDLVYVPLTAPAGETVWWPSTMVGSEVVHFWHEGMGTAALAPNASPLPIPENLLRLGYPADFPALDAAQFDSLLGSWYRAVLYCHDLHTGATPPESQAGDPDQPMEEPPEMTGSQPLYAQAEAEHQRQVEAQTLVHDSQGSLGPSTPPAPRVEPPFSPSASVPSTPPRPPPDPALLAPPPDDGPPPHSQPSDRSDRSDRTNPVDEDDAPQRVSQERDYRDLLTARDGQAAELPVEGGESAESATQELRNRRRRTDAEDEERRAKRARSAEVGEQEQESPPDGHPPGDAAGLLAVDSGEHGAGNSQELGDLQHSIALEMPIPHPPTSTLPASLPVIRPSGDADFVADSQDAADGTVHPAAAPDGSQPLPGPDDLPLPEERGEVALGDRRSPSNSGSPELRPSSADPYRALAGAGVLPPAARRETGDREVIDGAELRREWRDMEAEIGRLDGEAAQVDEEAARVEQDAARIRDERDNRIRDDVNLAMAQVDSAQDHLRRLEEQLLAAASARQAAERALRASADALAALDSPIEAAKEAVAAANRAARKAALQLRLAGIGARRAELAADEARYGHLRRVWRKDKGVRDTREGIAELDARLAADSQSTDEASGAGAAGDAEAA